MVTATVSNTPVSIQLSVGESTTVPTGEVWKVTVAMSGTTDNEYCWLKVNGEKVVQIKDANGGGGAKCFDMVFVGGDTIAWGEKYEDHSGCNISGFKVN